MTVAQARPVDYWTLNASGLASVSANWSNGTPQRGDDVVIAPVAPGVVVTLDTAGFVVGAFTLQGATGALQGGDLTVAKGAKLQSATILGPHALTLLGASQVSGLTLGGGALLSNYSVATQTGDALQIGVSATSSARVFNRAGGTWIDNGGAVGAPAGGVGFVNHGAFEDTAGAGALTVVSANFYSDGSVSVADSGSLEFAGRRARLAGALSGGLVDYASGLIATLGDLTVTATEETNFGKVDQIGALHLTGAQAIANHGTWNLDGDVSILVDAAQSASITLLSLADGTFNKTAGSGVSVVEASVNLFGGVNVVTGTLEFAGASSDFEGPITGAGTLEIGAGSALLQPVANARTISVAHLALAGGTTTVQGAVTDTGGFEGDDGATLDLGDAHSQLTLTGAVTLAGLDITGSGTLILDASTPELGIIPMNVSNVTIGGGAQVDDEGEVFQGGDVTLGDAVVSDAAGISIGKTSSWATWVLGGHNLLAGADPASIVTIGLNGNLVKSGTGLNVVAPAILNDGLDIPSGSGFALRGLQANGGTLDIKSAISGTGSLNIFTSSTLELDSKVGAGQHVMFFGSETTLYLADLTEFQGSIAGFGIPFANSSLLFGGGIVALGGVTKTAAAATLTLLDQNQVGHLLTLTGDFTNHTFYGDYSGGLLRVT